MALILVAVDFSAASLNAALYAAHLAKLAGAESITLTTVIPEHTYGSDGTPLASEKSERKTAVYKKLEELQVILFAKVNVPTKLHILFGDFDQQLANYIKEISADLMVMGVAETDSFETFFGTTHSIEMIKRTTLPILVVPEGAIFNIGFNKKMDVSLMVDNHYKIPTYKFEKWLRLLQPHVHLTHVDESFIGSPSSEEMENLHYLKQDLLRYDPTIHLLKGSGFSDAVNDFCAEQGVEMIFTFPAKHSFFNLLFAGSHTKKLIFRSKVPVLCFPVD